MQLCFVYDKLPWKLMMHGFQELLLHMSLCGPVVLK